MPSNLTRGISKGISIALSSASVPSVALAQSYDMMGSGYGMMGQGMGYLWVLYAAFAAAIFSLIFWWIYRIIVRKKETR